MSRFTTTKRFSSIGCTFRRLYVSDDACKSIYIVKKDGNFYLNYNDNGTITRYCEASSQKLIHIVREFEAKFMRDASKTSKKAIAIYEALVKQAYTTQSSKVDVIAHQFRVNVPNYTEVSISDIERALNQGRNFIKH